MEPRGAPITDLLSALPDDRRRPRGAVREPVLTLQLGLDLGEKFERLKRRRGLRSHRAGREDVGLNRRVVIGGVRRALRLVQPRLWMPRQALFRTTVREPRKRLRRRDDTAMRDFVRRACVGLPDRRGVSRRDEKQTRRGHGQRDDYFPYE